MSKVKFNKRLRTLILAGLIGTMPVINQTNALADEINIEEIVEVQEEIKEEPIIEEIVEVQEEIKEEPIIEEIVEVQEEIQEEPIEVLEESIHNIEEVPTLTIEESEIDLETQEESETQLVLCPTIVQDFEAIEFGDDSFEFRVGNIGDTLVEVHLNDNLDDYIKEFNTFEADGVTFGKITIVPRYGEYFSTGALDIGYIILEGKDGVNYKYPVKSNITFKEKDKHYYSFDVEMDENGYVNYDIDLSDVLLQNINDMAYKDYYFSNPRGYLKVELKDTTLTVSGYLEDPTSQYDSFTYEIFDICNSETYILTLTVKERIIEIIPEQITVEKTFSIVSTTKDVNYKITLENGTGYTGTIISKGLTYTISDDSIIVTGNLNNKYGDVLKDSISFTQDNTIYKFNFGITNKYIEDPIEEVIEDPEIDEPIEEPVRGFERIGESLECEPNEFIQDSFSINLNNGITGYDLIQNDVTYVRSISFDLEGSKLVGTIMFNGFPQEGNYDFNAATVRVTDNDNNECDYYVNYTVTVAKKVTTKAPVEKEFSVEEEGNKNFAYTIGETGSRLVEYKLNETAGQYFSQFTVSEVDGKVTINLQVKELEEDVDTGLIELGYVVVTGPDGNNYKYPLTGTIKYTKAIEDPIEDPEVDPEDPEVDPEDPEVDPEDPEVDPEDPEVDPEEPEVEPEEPEEEETLPKTADNSNTGRAIRDLTVFGISAALAYGVLTHKKEEEIVEEKGRSYRK